MAKIFRNNEIKLLVILLDCMLSILSYTLISQLFSLVQVQQLPNPTILNNAPWIFGMLITTYWLFDLYNFTGRREYTKSMYNLTIAHAVIAVELLIIDRYYPLTTLSASTVLIALGLQ